MGYYNSFHTHTRAVPIPRLPNYEAVVSGRGPYRFKPSADDTKDVLPPYTCSVFMQGSLAMKQELSSPFTVAYDRRWRNVHATLRGTQLLFHRSKTGPLFGKTYNTPQPGRLLKSYSLQHAEVGIAQDFKKTDPIPRSAFAKMVPAASRAKLYETDPQLFDPPREFTIRVRAEAEQFLMCVGSMEELLDWIEALCAAVDISMPLDERSDPRYRTLPRRNRRGQQNGQHSEGGSNGGSSANTLTLRFDESGNPEANQRFIEEQERILRSLYRRAAGSSSNANAEENGMRRANSPAGDDGDGDMNGDPDAEDLENPEMFLTVPGTSRPVSRAGSPMYGASSSPSRLRQTRSATGLSSMDGRNNVTDSNGGSARSARGRHVNDIARANSSPGSSSNGKPRSSRQVADPMRMRRRFAPNLHASSPRASDVVFIDGKRWKVSPETQTLHAWQPKPPRYNDHGFKKGTSSTITLVTNGGQSRDSAGNELGDGDEQRALPSMDYNSFTRSAADRQSTAAGSNTTSANESPTSDPSVDSIATEDGNAQISTVLTSSSNNARPTPLIRINSHHSSDDTSASTSEDDDLAMSAAPQPAPNARARSRASQNLSLSFSRPIVPSLPSHLPSRSRTPEPTLARERNIVAAADDDGAAAADRRPSTTPGAEGTNYSIKASAAGTTTTTRPRQQLQNKKSSGGLGFDAGGFASALFRSSKGKDKSKDRARLENDKGVLVKNGGVGDGQVGRQTLSLIDLL